MRYGTPLRYPGGKQKLAPFVAEILVANDLVDGHYAEPYAGGAGVAIALLLDGMVSHVHLNDCDESIYCFWTAVTKWPDAMCSRILQSPLTVDEWKRQREIVRRPTEHDVIDVGFATFYLNRCNRSGVLNGGLIGGLKQTGDWLMDARFRREDLARRVEKIGAMSESITVTRYDAEYFITDHAASQLPEDTLIYCDPPYYERAQTLYLNSYKHDDHVRLAERIQNDVKHKWLVSYDGHPNIIDMYRARRKFVYDLQYSAARAYKGREVFVFGDDLQIPSSSSLPAVHDALITLQAG